MTDLGIMWWIGDWWAFGEHRYGERAKIVEADDWEGRFGFSLPTGGKTGPDTGFKPGGRHLHERGERLPAIRNLIT